MPFARRRSGLPRRSILPARAGEVIRPYFLARHERMSATGAFATIILERVLDMLTVLVLLAVYVFFFAASSPPTNAVAFEAVKWAGGTAAVGALAALVVLFVLAGNPARLGQTLARLEQVLPSKLAGLLARVAEKFATGLGAVRRPGRLFVALSCRCRSGCRLRSASGRSPWRFTCRCRSRDRFWCSRCSWSAWRCRRRAPSAAFTRRSSSPPRRSSARPTTRRSARRSCCTPFTIGPTLLLGLFFAAQEGLNIAGMKQLADQAEPGRTV